VAKTQTTFLDKITDKWLKLDSLYKKQFGVLMALACLVVVASFMTAPFRDPSNIINILRQCSVLGIVVYAQSIVLISGGIDLSVGSIIGISGLTTGYALATGQPIWLAMTLGVAVGAACGFVNGILVVYTMVTPLIITLGTMTAYRGLILGITKGYPIVGLPDSFYVFGRGNIAGIPIPFMIMAAGGCIAHIFLAQTTLGRKIYGIGANENAMRLSGIRVNRVKVYVYTISGILCAIAGILLVSRLDSAQPMAGQSQLLPSIGAAAIGGTSIAGGTGNIIGAVLGTVMMGTISNAMVLLRVSIYWQEVVIGCVIIAAVSVGMLYDVKRRRKKDVA
jgi:ribose transport system permease protein